MTSLPERTTKKTTVPPIVALPSNGCKRAFPLLTVDLQRACHNIILLHQQTILPQLTKKLNFHFSNSQQGASV
jgi:hypothetical protein